MKLSSTPILESIQHAAAAANQINNIEAEIEEGKTKEFKIKVNDKVHDFVIQKENDGRIRAKYLGDFRVILQNNDSTTLEFIQQLLQQLNIDVIKYRCCDMKNNLLVHVLCWRGFVKYAHYFTDKFNSTICDKTGWTTLHYACYSNCLEAVQSVFQNSDKPQCVKIRDNYGNHPIDLTDNDNVRNFLTSSILDFQTIFRTSFRRSETLK